MLDPIIAFFSRIFEWIGRAIGTFIAWLLYLGRPDLLPAVTRRLRAFSRVLANKYYFDDLNEKVIAPGVRGLGKGLWRIGDEILIDGLLVNGISRTLGLTGQLLRLVQNGMLRWYAWSFAAGVLVVLFYLSRHVNG